MKRLLNIIMVLVLIAFTISCQQDEVVLQTTNSQQIVTSDDYPISVSMSMNISDPIKVVSRNGVSNQDISAISLLCFDGNGYFKVSAPADIDGMILTATIPSSTRIIHLLANQTLTDEQIKDIKHESDLGALQAAFDAMVYWARIEIPATERGIEKIVAWLKDQTISLLCNQAKVNVNVQKNKEGEEDFVLQGFEVVNTEDAGTIAPYYYLNNEILIPTHASSTFNLEDWVKEDYVNLLSKSNLKAEMTDVQDNASDIYVYETKCDMNASIILKGYNKFDSDKTPKYWRVAFADGDGNPINVRRNHCYTVNISGIMPKNCAADSFEDAKEIETSNMAWISIDQGITAISDTKVSLNVEKTKFVVSDFNDDLKVIFSIEHLDNTEFNRENLDVSWINILNFEDISISDTNLKVEVDPYNKAIGTVILSSSDLALDGNINKRKGEIIIKYGNRLQRKIEIEIIPKNNFSILKYNGYEGTMTSLNTFNFSVPIEKSKYQVDNYIVENLPIDKLIFSIPEDYPCEIPFNVLISASDFNVIESSSLMHEGSSGYGEDNDIGFKYVYRVTKTGTHEISLRYLNNLVTTYSSLKLEAEHFESAIINVNYIWTD